MCLPFPLSIGFNLPLPKLNNCHLQLMMLNPWVRRKKGKLKIEKNKMFQFNRGFPGWAGKESTCNAETWVRSLGWEDSPGEGKGYPLQYSGLEISMDYIVNGIAKSWTQLSDVHFHFSWLNLGVEREPCFLSNNFQKKWDDKAASTPMMLTQ